MTFKESQHLGGRDRWILEFKASLTNRASQFWNSWVCTEKSQGSGTKFLVWLPRSEYSAPVQTVLIPVSCVCLASHRMFWNILLYMPYCHTFIGTYSLGVLGHVQKTPRKEVTLSVICEGKLRIIYFRQGILSSGPVFVFVVSTCPQGLQRWGCCTSPLYYISQVSASARRVQ